MKRGMYFVEKSFPPGFETISGVYILSFEKKSQIGGGNENESKKGRKKGKRVKKGLKEKKKGKKSNYNEGTKNKMVKSIKEQGFLL